MPSSNGFGRPQTQPTRAYPWCCEVGQSLLALLKPDEHGVLKLPLSSSPEIHDNSLRAWLAPNSKYDLFCVKMLFLVRFRVRSRVRLTAESRLSFSMVCLTPSRCSRPTCRIPDSSARLPKLARKSSAFNSRTLQLDLVLSTTKNLRDIVCLATPEASVLPSMMVPSGWSDCCSRVRMVCRAAGVM